MIRTCIPSQAKADFLAGTHQLSDQYFLALYTSAADLGPDTVTYTPIGEVSGKGYRPGGLALTNPRTLVDNGAGCLTFDSVRVSVATFTARGYAVYNKTRGNKVIFIADFGGEYTATEGAFAVPIAADMICFD